MTLVQFFLLLGGIALFLYGMRLMGDGLKNVAGENLRVILENTTNNKYLGVLMGTGITMLIQSSSATTVMVIGFVSTGLMTLAQACGVIMGANIGTTITAQIIAFNFGSYAPLILFAGMIMVMFISRKSVQNVGMIVLGFGMLFMGVSTMGDAIEPLKQSPEFISFLTTLDKPLLAIAFGIVFTAILQSSSSSVGIIQTFALQGLITYNMSVYLVIGTSLGACMPAVIAMFAATREGKRSAMLSIVFNFFRTIICVVLVAVLPQFLVFVQGLSPNDIARQIANTHTLLAIIPVILTLPFTNQFAKITQKLIPITEQESNKIEKKLEFITENLNVPSAIALSQAKREICRMGKIAVDNLALAVEAVFEKNTAKAAQALETEDVVDYLNHSITHALVGMHALDLTDKQQNTLARMILVVSDIERIGDHAENIAEYTNLIIERNAAFSESAQEELRNLAEASIKSVKFSLDIYENERVDLLDEAETLEQMVDDLQNICVNNHIARLITVQCNPTGGLIYVDMVTDLERCSDHGINIAYALDPSRDT